MHFEFYLKGPMQVCYTVKHLQKSLHTVSPYHKKTRAIHLEGKKHLCICIIMKDGHTELNQN
jgi:hypothetical protein